jgi:hypothetical protein
VPAQQLLGGSLNNFNDFGGGGAPDQKWLFGLFCSRNNRQNAINKQSKFILYLKFHLSTCKQPKWCDAEHVTASNLAGENEWRVDTRTAPTSQ